MCFAVGDVDVGEFRCYSADRRLILAKGAKLFVNETQCGPTGRCSYLCAVPFVQNTCPAGDVALFVRPRASSFVRDEAFVMRVEVYFDCKRLNRAIAIHVLGVSAAWRNCSKMPKCKCLHHDAHTTISFGNDWSRSPAKKKRRPSNQPPRWGVGTVVQCIRVFGASKRRHFVAINSLSCQEGGLHGQRGGNGGSVSPYRCQA